MRQPKERKSDGLKAEVWITALRCDQGECHVRRIELIERDPRDGTPRPTILKCPACGEPLTIEQRRTPGEYRAMLSERAIALVNAALWCREEYGNWRAVVHALTLKSLAMLDLGELPEDWHSVTPRPRPRHPAEDAPRP